MNKYTTLTKLFIIGLIATLITACGGSSSSYNANGSYTADGEEIILGSTYETCQYGSATHEGHVVDSKTNKGINNVEVSVSGCTVETDSKGFYKLSNIKSVKRAPITFNKDGYYKNSEIIAIEEETNNHLAYSLDPYASWSKSTFSSNEGLEKDNIRISDTTVYTNKETGEKYKGKINTYWYQKDTNSAKGRDALPGNYQGIDSNGIIVNFVSYTFAVVELKDKDNNPLNISAPMTIQLKNVSGTTDQVIPLWYYDYDRAVWVEKGMAQRDEEGIYHGQISHAGTWSLSKPVESEMGIYQGRIVNENDQPMTNVRIKAKGKNWVTQDLSTDENGAFSVYVVPNEKFSLSAYDYNEGYGANFPVMLSAIQSGDVVAE